MKIEDKLMGMGDSRRSADFEEYVLTLKKLKVGQSFCVAEMPSHYRITLSVCRIILGREFASKKDGKGYRVGRIK